MMAQQGFGGCSCVCVCVHAMPHTCISGGLQCARAHRCAPFGAAAEMFEYFFSAQRRVYLGENKLAVVPGWSSLIYVAE